MSDEAEPVRATDPVQEHSRVFAALEKLADEVDFGIDLSDDDALSGEADEHVSCTRSTREWRRLRGRIG